MEQLGVFAKFWQSGKVKTRLAASVGSDNAAELYRLFLESTLRMVEQNFHGSRVLAYSPVDRIADFTALSKQGGWRLEAQSDGDLGQRMAAYFRRAFENGAEKVVLIGSDSPNLPPDRLSAATRALDDTELVLGPSDDGGYYLIGMRRFLPEIFETIAWGTEAVYAQTVQATQRNRICYQTLPTWYDIDDVNDLEKLRNALRGRDECKLSRLIADLLPQ